MMKALLTFLSISATLGLAACSDSSSDSPAPKVKPDPAAAAPTSTNKILGTEFKVGKALAVVEPIPDSQNAHVAVQLFEEGVDVNCETLFRQEPRTMLQVGGLLELNKAVVIAPRPSETETPGTPPEGGRPPSLSANDSANSNPGDGGAAPEENPGGGASAPGMEIPTGFEKGTGVAHATFLTKDGQQDKVTAGYLIIQQKTDKEIRGMVAAKGENAEKPSVLEKTDFVAEICAIPTGAPEGGRQPSQPEQPETGRQPGAPESPNTPANPETPAPENPTTP